MKTTMRFARSVVIAALSGVLLAGCQGVPLDLSKRAVSDRAQIDPTKGRPISAEATGFQLLLLIPIAVNGRQRNAYEELLRQAGDDVIGDITITESWQWALVGTVYKTRIDATAYPRSAPATPAKTGDGGSS